MDAPLRLLLVEDSEPDAELLIRALRRAGMEVFHRRVMTAPAMEEALREETWDVVISDFSLPAFSGPAALALLQASGLDLPFIIVSGVVGEETAVLSMKAGAHDFVLKQNLARLGPAVARELKEARGRKERKDWERALRESQRNFEEAQEIGRCGSWFRDLATGRGQWSAALFRLFALTPGPEAPSLGTFLALVHPEDRSFMDDMIAGLLASAGPFEVDYRVLLPAGGLRHFHETGEILRDAQGVPVGVRGFTLDLTDRVKGEEELRTSRARLQAVLDSLQEGVILLDAGGVIQVANAAVEGITGLPREAFDGWAIQDSPLRLHHQDGRPWATEALHWREASAPGNLPAALVRPDGRVALVDLRISPFTQGEGTVISIRDTTLEVDHLRRREIASEIHRLARLPLPLATFANQVAERVARWSGFDRVDLRLALEPAPVLRGSGFRPLLPPPEGGACGRDKVRGGPRCLCEAILQGRVGGSPRVTARGSLGIHRHQGPGMEGLAPCVAEDVETLGLIPLRAGDQVLGILRLQDPRPNRFRWMPLAAIEEAAGLVSTVLAEKKAEEAKRAVEQRFQSLTTLAPVAFFITDARGSLTYVNPKWCELTDMPGEQALGRPWTFPIHEEDRPALQAHRRRLVEAQGTWGLECRTRPRPDGEVLWIYCTATALRDDQGRALGVLGMAADITERKRFETRLRDMEKVTARGRMAAYIAHEINNPLAGIKNAFQLLEPAIPADHPHYRYKDLIKREIDRISGIIRTLYHVYRPDPLEARETSPLEILQDISSLLLPLCRNHDVRIEVSMPEPLDRVELPGGLLRQVVFNLVQNAVEASPKGGTVLLEAGRGEGRLVFTVRDEGPGIPAEDGDRIFESGYSSKHGPGMSGLGLGLATCKSLVESLHGQLTFGPGPGGRGTAFRVDVPLQ